MTDSAIEGCSCKLGRVGARFDAPDAVAHLARRHDETDASLRELRDGFNRRIVERVLDAHGVDVLADARAIYDVLYGDDASEARRGELEDRLERDGVPVADLRDAFVSHVTVRTHLRECLDRETGRDLPASVTEARSLIEWARTRDESIISNALSRLVEAGEIAVDDMDVNHSVSVSCGTCGSRYRVDELLDRGGCECRGDGR